MKKVYIFLFTVLLVSSNIFANDSPTGLYLDIARAISTARGNIDLYFTAGSWTKIISQKKVIIDFAENQRANLKFAYSGGQLQDGSKITFTPGIHVYVKAGNTGLSLRLDEIIFDDNGKFKDWSVKYDNPGTNNLNHVASVQDALRLNDKSENLFSLKLFKNFGDARKSDQNGNIIPSNGKPLLTSIIIKKPNEAEPGLTVSMIPNTTIHFSKKTLSTTFDNVVTFNTGDFEIRYLEYDVEQQKVECEIADFNLNLQSGRIQNSGLDIKVGSGSKLKFSRLRILHDNSNSEINADNGIFNVQVGAGTKVTLYKTSRYPSELVFENGEMNLVDFSYQNTDEIKTVFKLGGTSTLKVATRSGSLSLFGDKSYLSLSEGMLEATLDGTWNSTVSNPNAHLIVSLFQLSLDGGYLPITEHNIVGIESGFIKSEKLRFDASEGSSLEGEIKDLHVTLDDASKFIIPNGLQCKFR